MYPVGPFILGEIGPQITTLVDWMQILTCRPLIVPLIHQQVILEGSEYPKCLHKLLLPDILYSHSGWNGCKSSKTGQFDPSCNFKAPNKAQFTSGAY